MIRIDAKSYIVAGWIGAAAMVAAVVWLGIQGNWLGFGVSLLFLVSSVLFMTTRSDLPSLFDLLFVAAALVNGAGWVWGLYTSFIFYDEIAHSYTTFAGSLWLGFAVYYSMRAHFRSLAFGFAIVTFGLAAGAVWEMIEWSFTDLTDPVVDLMMDGIGALVAGILGTWILKLEPSGDRDIS